MAAIKKLLVVEDETPLLHALHDRFAREGYLVLEAQDGKEGLGMALREHPDLILLDLVMPVMDGLTMLRELRKNEWGITAKIIILTNLSDSEKIDEAVASGAYDYLVKTDWKLEDVVAKVRAKIG